MNKARFSLLTLLILFAQALIAMEDQQQPNNSYSLIEVFAKAREETRPLSLDRKVNFAEAMDESNEFKALLAAEHPVRVRMTFEEVVNLARSTQQRTKKTSKEYLEAWAPRTGAAVAACGLLSCLKPYLAGLIDSIPTEEATIGLFCFWYGRVYELNPKRTGINNENVTADIALTKASNITQEKIKKIAAQQEKDKELDRILEQALDDTDKAGKLGIQMEAGVELAQLAMQQTQELTLEEKKNQ